jgi:hypothetical protein
VDRLARAVRSCSCVNLALHTMRVRVCMRVHVRV